MQVSSIVDDVSVHIRREANKKRDFEIFLKTDLSPQHQDDVAEVIPENPLDKETNYEIKKLNIDKDILPQLCDILIDYFPKEDKEELLRILQTGDKANRKLHFGDNGNKFSDVFKQLFDANCIIGRNKREVMTWITENFTFQNDAKITSFIYKTLEGVISSKQYTCKNPIVTLKRNPATGKYSISKY